jgi:Cft2 family RNA processing exonuclease
MRYARDERANILMKIGKFITRPIYDNGSENFVRVTALGGFRQVGRSCMLLQTKHSKVLIDCGLDPSSDNTPFFNAPELQPFDKLDAVVITHAHMDHCGLLPVLFRYGYNGPVYCTPPTRDLMALMQLDSIKLMWGEAKKAPFDASHVRDEVLHVIPLQYEKTTDISPDVRLTLYNAGHILGSSIAHFNIGNGFHNVAFTGDTKYEKTWLFNQANTKFIRLESVVMESTYGGHNDMQPSRGDASKELHDLLQQATEHGGKVVIPVFAVGRSQEVMLVIEELMRTGRLPQMPVYLDGMIWEATAIHTAYPEYLNSQLKTQIFQQSGKIGFVQVDKAVDSCYGLGQVVGDGQGFGYGQICQTAFHPVDYIVLDSSQLLLGQGTAEDIDLCGADGGAVALRNDLDTLGSRVGSLVVLTGQGLYSKDRITLGQRKADIVHLRLRKHGINSVLKECFFDVFRIVAVQYPDTGQLLDLQKFPNLMKQAVCLVGLPRLFFNKYTIYHINSFLPARLVVRYRFCGRNFQNIHRQKGGTPP